MNPTTRRTPPADSFDVPIRAVIFDMGNVVLPFDHMRAAHAAAANSDLSPRAVYDRVFGSGLVARYDLGAVGTRAFLKAAREAVGFRGALADLRRCWNEIFHPSPAMERLVHRLAGRYRLVLLSNTNRSHFEYARRTYPIIRTFRRRVLSYEVGLAKPDPAIYRLAVAKAGVPADACLYIDDIPAYTAAAADLGIRAVTFRGVTDLRRRLRRAGLRP